MNLLHRLWNYIVPPVDSGISGEIDRKSMRNIHKIAIIILIFESLSFIVFLSTKVRSFGHEEFISTISVAYCILLCALAVFLSKRMLQSKDLTRKQCVAFKVFFFVAFSVWAMYADYRHYKVSEQMLTFYSVNLIMACFIVIKPWIGMILSGGSFLTLYLMLFFFDRAAGIQPLNYIVLAFATIACNAVHYHSHIRACERERSLTRSNKALEEASRRDGLTGLHNRLALEEDAALADGRHTTIFMIDINYFKEINDEYGHVVGDQLLKETSESLKKLFPEGHYYRYGGDEFLVLTHRPAQDNYGATTFDFTHESSGAEVSLSIGSAQGDPVGYDELFELISQADKALYVVKARTHSVEYGGHERRKNVETNRRDSLPESGDENGCVQPGTGCGEDTGC